MELSKNGFRVDSYKPSYVGEKVIISIDSSKSNTAMFVANAYGEVLDDYEISGAGNDTDVYQLCWDTRNALTELFKGAKVLRVGIEDIITKKNDSYKGLEIHQSRAKITAVFDNLIFFFQDRHNLTPERINNWMWKSNVLPEQFRSREHDKGSKDYLKSIGNKYGNRKDDVTDAYCILQFMKMSLDLNIVYDIKEPIKSNKRFNYVFYPKSSSIPPRTKRYAYNMELTFEQNLDTASYMLGNNFTYGCFEVPVKMLSISDIYSDKLKGTYPMNTDSVLLFFANEV